MGEDKKQEVREMRIDDYKFSEVEVVPFNAKVSIYPVVSIRFLALERVDGNDILYTIPALNKSLVIKGAAEKQDGNINRESPDR